MKYILFSKGDMFMDKGSKWVLYLVVILIVGAIVYEVVEQNSRSKKPKYTIEQTKQANAETLRILGAIPMESDPVEKITWYRPEGNSDLSPYSRIRWYAGAQPMGTSTNDTFVWMRVNIIHYSTGTDWVFWKKLIFSTDQGNWEYYLDPSDTKNTKVVSGGKYETADLKFTDIKQGVKLLITGTNPIIRLSGTGKYYDMQISPETIESLKTAYYLSDQLAVSALIPQNK